MGYQTVAIIIKRRIYGGILVALRQYVNLYRDTPVQRSDQNEK